MKSRRTQTADQRRRKLLGMLASGDRYSGEDLARQLRVTRSAVWKLIRNLRDLGIDVEAIAHQGYKLPRAVQLYDEEVIRAAIGERSKKAVNDIHVLLTVDSTNRYLVDAQTTGLGQASVCVAEVQTAGRGRRGRSWLAPFGSGVCLSLAWQFAEPPPNFSALSLAVGVAIVRALQRLGCGDVKLKWPNDIVYKNRKLAGVLIDMRGEADGPARVVIGIGLNLHMPATTRLKLAEQQATLVTDLHDAMSGSSPDRNVLVGAMVDDLIEVLQHFEQHGFAPFETEWQRHDSLRHAPVRVLTSTDTIAGVANGVAADGALLVDVNGQVRRFMSGDVSLRAVT